MKIKIDYKMISVLFSFFSQCFTLLEDKKDAGKLRQCFSGQECPRCGVGRGYKKRRTVLLLGFWFLLPAVQVFPQTVTFQRGGKGSQCEVVPARAPAEPQGCRRDPQDVPSPSFTTSFSPPWLQMGLGGTLH